jgi:DDE_Tnp_1-associated
MRDVRDPRGKRHLFVAVLALAWSARLCGYRSDTAIAEWGRHYGHQCVRALGFPRRPPCAATLHTVVRRVDRECLEAKLGAWAEGLLGKTPGPGGQGMRWLWTARRSGAARSRQTNDMPVILALLRHLVLVGQVVTRDALLTQRQMAQQMVAVGATL